MDRLLVHGFGESNFDRFVGFDLIAGRCEVGDAGSGDGGKGGLVGEVGLAAEDDLILEEIPSGGGLENVESVGEALLE